MRVTEKLLHSMISLLEGETLPSSSLKGKWVEQAEAEGLLIGQYSGSRKNYRLSAREAFLDFMYRQNELLRNPYRALEMIAGEAERSDLAAESGASKTRKVRACPGFAVNSFQPIAAFLDGKALNIDPQEGTFLFICNWDSFSIGEEAVVIGVENMENFRKVTHQQDFFYGCLDSYDACHPENPVGRRKEKYPPLLFVARYPQSKDLVKWLERIPNHYFHFGDYDLEGIEIFQTEFEKYLIKQKSGVAGKETPDSAQSCRNRTRIVEYLIPPDIEERLSQGSRERYEEQYRGTRNVTSGNPSLSRLITLINHHRRCYDQEGYIARPLPGKFGDQ